MFTDTPPNVTRNPGPQADAFGAPVGSGGAPAFGSGAKGLMSGNDSAPEMVQSVAHGAHETIDRLAEKATPHLQHLQENLAGAAEMLDERSDQIREMTDEWLETLRCTVRENPLAAVGAALAVGLLVARLSR